MCVYVYTCVQRVGMQIYARFDRARESGRELRACKQNRGN